MNISNVDHFTIRLDRDIYVFVNLIYKVRSTSVSISYIIGFDRRSFIQEELHDVDMAFLRGNLESGSSTLLIKTGTRKRVHTFSTTNRCIQLICDYNINYTHIDLNF